MRNEGGRVILVVRRGLLHYLVLMLVKMRECHRVHLSLFSRFQPIRSGSYPTVPTPVGRCMSICTSILPILALYASCPCPSCPCPWRTRGGTSCFWDCWKRVPLWLRRWSLGGLRQLGRLGWDVPISKLAGGRWRSADRCRSGGAGCRRVGDRRGGSMVL